MTHSGTDRHQALSITLDRDRRVTDVRVLDQDRLRRPEAFVDALQEAFAVADRMAVMRAGRLVQSGTVEEVWRQPADAETARFLGYARVVVGAAADALLAGACGQGENDFKIPLARRVLVATLRELTQ